MRKIIILLSSIIAAGAFAQGNFKFVEESHDFGKVPEGDSIAYEFEFTNVGDQPLKITNVQPSCGCTVPKWPNDAIQPGAKGRILAKYATKGRVGPFTKYMTITSDAIEPSKQIKFVGEVLAAAVDTTQKAAVKPTPVTPQETKTTSTSGTKTTTAKKVSLNIGNKSGKTKGTAKKATTEKTK